VAWQLVTIVTATVLTATLAATGRAPAFGTRAARCGTALAIPPVVKTRIATLLLATAAITATFTATIALAFKTRCALWAVAA
jgi:hypothetical protein